MAPNFAALHGLQDALAWCEQNYVTLESSPSGMWLASISNNDVEMEAVAESLEQSVARLRGKLAGDIPPDDSDLTVQGGAE